MKIKTNIKGIALAVAATISFSNVYLFSKMAMKDINLASFGLLWFGLALFYNLLFYWFFTKRKKIKDLSKKSKTKLVMIGCSELISISAFFLSIKLTDNPAIVSFLANTSPIFVIIISIGFFKTRYSIYSLFGILVTLLGVVIMNYNNSSLNLHQFVTPASISALIFAVFYGVSLVLARSEAQKISTSLITVCRTLFLFGGFLLFNLFQLQLPSYTSQSLFYITIGSILGPFLGILLTFASLKYIDASVTTLIGTSRSIFILLGAFVFMNIFPNQFQLLGGTLTILGIFIISIADIKIRNELT